MNRAILVLNYAQPLAYLLCDFFIIISLSISNHNQKRGHMNQLQKESSRREFFKKVFFYTSAGALIQIFAKNLSFAAASALSLIDMTGKVRTDADNKECVGVAKGIGYVEDVSKALAAKTTTKADRTGSGGKVFKPADQTCDTCMFYNYKKATPPEATCQLLPKCLVHAKGSCNSWSPKA
jgi:High potential iron-sulfur protein